MKLIAGLGNPGPRYAESRHNVGYMVVDELARRWNADVSRYDRHFEAQLGQANRFAEVVLLLKPTTFMNLSGRSVGAAARYYRLPPDAVLVVFDDLDLQLGQLRARADGSAGGHKGLEDILRHFSTTEVPRLRIGIGKTHRSATVDHVLGKFTPDERDVMEQAIATAADAADCWLHRGMQATMNEYNRRPNRKTEARQRSGDAAAEGESS